MFCTEALTLEALKTLEDPIRRKQPFYLYFAHYSNHTPIQRDERFIRKYLDAGMDEQQARYASMVEGMDKSLGDVLDYLEANSAGRERRRKERASTRRSSTRTSSRRFSKWRA